MRARTVAAALICVAVAATSAPTAAEEVTGVGVNNGLLGVVATVYAEDEPESEITPPELPDIRDWIEAKDPPDKELKKYRIAADCEFNGVLTPNNTLVVNMYGNADATGPQGAPVPLLTVIGCEITNVPSGGTNSLYRDFSLNGPHSSVADSTAASSVPEWAVRPITVCVSGFAIYGPMPLKWIWLKRKCQTPDGEAAAALSAAAAASVRAIG